MFKTLRLVQPFLLWISIFGCWSPAFSMGGKTGLVIKDFRHRLNPAFKKILRTSTRYIIIHTSEAGLKSTLRTLSRGKRIGSYRTQGGHSHYAIARNGTIYRILDHAYRADHTGLSMWQGIDDISSCSLGIELVGYHYGTVTPQQYQSVARLLDILQRIYRIEDKNVLTHSQVSYGRPNFWFKRPHRGRKRCARNFDRWQAGLKDAWTFDPDVRSGRLSPDPQIHKLFYGRAARNRLRQIKAESKLAGPEPVAGLEPVDARVSNLISATNTAWTIAGEDYNSANTVYVFPNGNIIRGDKVEQKRGWNNLPPGTQVLVNQPLDRETKKGPIYEITGIYTAWSFAGSAYRESTTKYFFPGGRIVPGDQIRDWDSLPDKTRLIIGYEGPLLIEDKIGKTPWGLAGKACNQSQTIYTIPGRGLVTGNNIGDFNDLPRGSKIFIKITK